MVRLKAGHYGGGVYQEPRFNSLMVRLKVAAPAPAAADVKSFNSLMVRLKVELAIVPLPLDRVSIP